MKKILISLLLIFLLTNSAFGAQKINKISNKTVSQADAQAYINKNYFLTSQIDPQKIQYFKEYNMYRIEIGIEDYFENEKTFKYLYTIPGYSAGVFVKENREQNSDYTRLRFVNLIKYKKVSLIRNNNVYIPKSWFNECEYLSFNFLHIKFSLSEFLDDKGINEEIREYQNDIVSLGKKDRKLVEENNFVQIGMSEKVARIIAGSPDSINTSEGTYGTHEQWVYDKDDFKSEYLYFNNDILTSMQSQN